MGKILDFLGLGLSKEDKELLKMLDNAYPSLRVVGRGTLMVDAKDAHQDMVEHGYYEKAKELVERSR